MRKILFGAFIFKSVLDDSCNRKPDRRDQITQLSRMKVQSNEVNMTLFLDQARAQTCLLMFRLGYQSYCYCPPTCPTASLSFLFTHLRIYICL